MPSSLHAGPLKNGPTLPVPQNYVSPTVVSVTSFSTLGQTLRVAFQLCLYHLTTIGSALGITFFDSFIKQQWELNDLIGTLPKERNTEKVE